MDFNYKCSFEEVKKQELKRQPAVIILEYPESKSMIIFSELDAVFDVSDFIQKSLYPWNNDKLPYRGIYEDFMRYANKKYSQMCYAIKDITICVHYCDNKEMAQFLYGLILYKIKLNNKTELYYNTSYPMKSQVEELEQIYLKKQRETECQEVREDFNINVDKIIKNNLREQKEREYNKEVLSYKHKHYTELKYNSYACCKLNFQSSFGGKLYNGYISPEQPLTFNPIMCSSLEDICSNSGVYQFTFLNGRKYIGKSSNIRKRIIEHLFHIRYSRTAAKWYVDIHNYYEQEGKIFETLYEYFNYIIANGKLEVHYTKSEIEATQLEKIELAKIYQNEELRNQYYNSQYYIEEDGKFKLVNMHLHKEKV